MKDISKIISITFLTISITLLFYIYFRDEVINSGLKHNYYKNYYFFTFFAILVSTVSFFIKDKFKINFSIILFSSILALYTVETFFFFKSSHYQVLKADIKFDIRTKLDFFIDYKKKNPEVVVSVSPDRFIAEQEKITMPLSGISKKETILCNENGYFSTFNSDRYGFNNPDHVWDKKGDTFLLIGDSFVNGSCVNEKNTISSYLRNLKITNNIINIGYSGNGPLREYASLREYLHLTNTKKVFWFYYEGNDLIDLEDELKNDVLKKYLKNINFKQNLKDKQNVLDNKIYNSIDKELKKKLKDKEQEFKISFPESLRLNLLIFQNLFKLYNVRQLLKVSFNKNKTKDSLIEDLNPNFQKILNLTKELVEKNDAKLYFIYLPEFNRYKSRKKIRLDDHNKLEYNSVIKTVTNLNIPIIDIHQEIFKKYKDPLKFFPFKSPYHYTEEMYKMISQNIVQRISDK